MRHLSAGTRSTYGTKPACSCIWRNSERSRSSWICLRSSSSFFCSPSCFCSAFHTVSMFRKLPVCHPFLFRNLSAMAPVVAPLPLTLALALALAQGSSCPQTNSASNQSMAPLSATRVAVVTTQSEGHRSTNSLDTRVLRRLRVSLQTHAHGLGFHHRQRSSLANPNL